jgi:cytochrome c oxidase assembly protein subunit 15
MQTGAHVSRLREFTLSPARFRTIALANVVTLLVVVATGATVRLTASGLGCRHWPGCQAGAFLPDKGYHSYVEFSNRVVAGVTVTIALLTLVASLLTRVQTWVRWVAFAAVVGGGLQAPLGKITVDHNLDPRLVMTHYLLSIVVLGLGAVVALEVWNIGGVPEKPDVRALAGLVAIACATLVVTGTFATASGPHSGSVAVPRVWSFHPALWLHVRATAVFGLAFAVLLVLLVRRRSSSVWVALVVLAALAAQMIVGEVQYRTHLPWWLVIGHVTLAATVWAVAVAFVFGLWRPRRIA